MNDELRDTDESVVDEQTTSITEDTAIDTCEAESLVNESEDTKKQGIIVDGEKIVGEYEHPKNPESEDAKEEVEEELNNADRMENENILEIMNKIGKRRRKSYCYY